MATSSAVRVPGSQTAHPARILTLAVAVGIGCELALHNNLLHGAPIGAGFTIAGVTAAGAIVAGRAWTGRPPSPAAAGLAVLAAAFAVLASWRAAPELAAANAAAVAGLLTGATYLYRGRRLSELTLAEYPLAGARTTRGVLGAPFQVGARLAPGAARLRPRLARTGPVLRGIALAALPLFVFAILFASADAVFADLLGRPFDVELSLGGFVAGAVFAAGFGWVALGALWYATTHDDYPDPDDALPPMRLGTTEAGILVGTVVALFAGFVAIQFAYLFGGAATVADTGGLTYSEYARQGFFQLLVVAGLAIGLVLAVDHLVNSETRSRLIDRLHLLLVGLTGVVAASAVVRLSAYMDEFGLSKLRLYAAAMLVWVAFLLVWTAATVLRARKSRFPAGAFLAGLAVLAALNVANPDARIAQVNLDRQLDGGRALDVRYATESLSADAVPVLVDGLAELPACDRARLATGLLANADDAGGGWRSFNLGRNEARHLLAGAAIGGTTVDGC